MVAVYQIIVNHLRSLTVDIDGIFINASLPCNMSEISMLSPDPAQILENFWGQKVFLELYVKHDKNWWRTQTER